jgi:predicted chitinase
MIISPPFLPDRAGSSEEAWLDAAMAQPASRLASTNAPEGSFPLSLKLGWHNGVHIQAPASGGAHLPVRAVADGKVVFVHAPTAPNNDLGHPLNYNPFHADTPTAAWTSDGFVVIEHRTDIGAEGNVATEVVYYSACMHMASIANCPKTAAPWAVGDAVCRKDALGTPGQIYGHEGQVHFEICCDEANLRRLTRRGPDWVDPLAMPPPTANGRVDSIFGSVYIYLPAAAPTSTSMPTSQLRVANGSGGAASPGSDHFLPNTLHSPQWVQITCEKGAATLTSYDSLGARIGAPRSDSRYDYIGGAGASAAVKAAANQSFEYDLYAVCNDRHGALDAATRAASSPSGWYELLRFGRNLGPDPLPANAAHWRKIVTPAGEVWADLNAPGTFKFSDADFLPVMGWNCFDDDPNADLRCDSLRMKTLIRDPDPKNEQRMERAELARRLGEASVRTKLRRTICKFPSEWDRTTIEARYGWLETEDFKTADDDAAGAQKWDRFVKHARAVTFADLPKAFLDADWRFHPREFVGVMRRCGWLGLREMAQLLPRRSVAARHVSWMESVRRFRDGSTQGNGMPPGLQIAVGKAFRKYGLTESAVRQAHFMSQCFQETGALQYNTETGNDRYLRTMYEVITPAEAGADYDDRNGVAWRLGLVYHKVNGHRVPYSRNEYVALRPAQVQAKAQSLGNVQAGDGQRFRGRGLIQLTGRVNYSSYASYRGKNYTTDPNSALLAADAFISTDVALKYWINAGTLGGASISHLADAGSSSQTIELVTRAVNGGITHLENRTEYFGYVWSLLNDVPVPRDSSTLERQKEDT